MMAEKIVRKKPIIGMIVTIAKRIGKSSDYTFGFTDEMIELTGRKARINYVSNCNSTSHKYSARYKIRLLGDEFEEFDWQEQMFEEFLPKKEKEQTLPLKAGENIRTYVKRALKSATDKERKKWLETYQRCILPTKVEQAINDAITIVLRPEKFEEWGINSSFEKGLTNSILLYGPPGTGKTMIAESIAAVLNKNIMSLSTGDVQSNIPGQTERNIAQAFQKAKEENVVLVIDECDSLLSDRNLVGAIMGSEINELLRQIENYDGVVVLTTNRIHRLDPALERRIISKIELGKPEKPARQQIWESLIPKKMPLAKDVDKKILAEAEFTGGQIKNTILLAARRAIAKNKKEVSMEDFVVAIEQEHNAGTDFKRRKEVFIQ